MPRELEAVEVGHADVDQHHRDVVAQELLERLGGGAGGDQVLAEVLEDRLIAEELARLIVDQQDRDSFVGAHGPPLRHRCHRRRGPQRWSHIRSADSSCSVLTGLAR